MSNFNNFNDIKRYIDESISNLRLPDHYKGQVSTYSKSLVPTGILYLGTASKIIKVFSMGDRWLVGDTKTIYTFDGISWSVLDELVDPWNGDFYFTEYYLENNNSAITRQVQANITYNGNTKTWDVSKDLYAQPDGDYLILDGITGQNTVSDKLRSYQDALSVLGTNNTINFIVQKTNGSVGVEKRTLSGSGFIKVANGVLSVDTTSYISALNITGGNSESNKYIEGISVSGNTFTVTKKSLPTPPTLSDLNGQPYNQLLDSLSKFTASNNGFLGIVYDPAGATPETKWKLSLSDQLVTSTLLTNTLNSYQQKHNMLTKISSYSGNMVNGNDYILNIHQNSSTIGDFTVTTLHRANIIEFGTDSGSSGTNKFLSNITKDANGNLVRSWTEALTSLNLIGANNETGKALTGVTYGGGSLTFTKQSFLQEITNGTSTGAGNVITDVSAVGNKINIVKGITALTSITKPMVEGVLIGTITTHNHDGKYDASGSASSALSNAKTYTDSQITTIMNDLFTNGSSNNNKLLQTIATKVNEMITQGKFPDFDDPIE